MDEVWGGLGWGSGERGSLVMLPVHRPSLCISLAGVKCVCEGSMVVSTVEWSHLCKSL